MHRLHKGANALSCDLVSYHPGFHFLLPDIHATYHIPLHASRLVSNTEPFSILCYRFIASQESNGEGGSGAIVAFCSERWHKYPGWRGEEGDGEKWGIGFGCVCFSGVLSSFLAFLCPPFPPLFVTPHAPYFSYTYAGPHLHSRRAVCLVVSYLIAPV